MIAQPPSLRRLRRAAILMVAACTLGAGSAAAGGATPAPTVLLDALLGGALAPPEVAPAVQAICASDHPLNRRDVEQALARPQSAEVLFGVARVLRCKATPELAPALWTALLASKASFLPRHPDLYGPVLDALTALPFDAATAGLADARFTGAAEASWYELEATWLAPIAGVQPGAFALPPPERLAAMEERLRRRVRELVALGPGSLIAMRPDRDDGLMVLIRDLQSDHLAELIAEGSRQELEVALEAARHPAFDGATLRDAALERLATDPALEAALGDATRALGGRPHHDPPDVARMQPPWDPSAVGPTTTTLEREPTRHPLDRPLVFIASTSLGLALLLLVGSRLSPRLRAPGFRLAAIALSPLAFVALEVGLGLGGVAPRMDSRASFSPSRVVSEHFVEGEWGGGTWVQATAGDMRNRSFPRDKPAGGWRVVTLGESSVFGNDFPTEQTFSSVLERRLAALHPDRTVEVINAGIGAATSDEIALAAFEALAYDPDLLISWFGFNDLTLLPVVVEFRAWSLRGLWARYLLDRFRLVTVLEGTLRPLVPAPVVAPGLRDGTPAPQERDAARELAVLHAVSNLGRIGERARRQGVPTIVAAQYQSPAVCGADPQERCVQDQLLEVASRGAALGRSTLVDIGPELQRLGLFASDPPTQEFFWDDVHPTAFTHAVIGEALAPTASRLLQER